MFCMLETATCTDLDRYIAFCHFPHVEANCWNHVFIELTALWREREGERGGGGDKKRIGGRGSREKVF